MTRQFLRAAAVLALLSAAPAARAAVVNDVTGINPIMVDRVAAPSSVEEIQRLVRKHSGPISIGGGRYSMGGQTATEGALYLDMRKLDRILSIDPKEKTVTVEAGATWRAIQDAIDPQDLSLKIMQSFSNFTVGGALSVNCHGRYVNQGPLIRAVRSIKVVLADGKLVEADPKRNSEIFFGAIGGYGGLGVIVEATFDLEKNERLERKALRMPVGAYRTFFEDNIKGSLTAVFHNADLYPPAYDTVSAITFSRTDRPLTQKARLHKHGARYWLSRLVYVAIADYAWGKKLRMRYIDPWRLRRPVVVWRNYEASYDVQELEPFSRAKSTYVLQEYFVPIERFSDFVPKLREILQKRNVNALNVSIRHARKDPGSLMAWARQECFAFVLYYRQGTSAAEREDVAAWTRELIDAALSVGGTYYLPYQIVATPGQFKKAYPDAGEFVVLKKKLDPTYKFRNRLWDRYAPPPDAPERAKLEAQRAELMSTKGYARPEDQTFLTMPEWYIVFSADEQAEFLRQNLPSQFPYFGAARQFWTIYRSVRRASGAYPSNWGARAMLWTIGASFTAEYWLVGAYERTIGRLVEKSALQGKPGERGQVDFFANRLAQDYATFIHTTPWYKYPFGPKIGELWNVQTFQEPYTFRRTERKVFLTLLLAGKTVWADIIRYATGAAYSPESMDIQAWVISPRDPADVFPGIRTIKTLEGGGRLISILRYEHFRNALAALSAAKVRFVEIAGNRTIALTVVAPAGWDKASAWGDVILEWPVLTEPGVKRVAIAVPVGRLHEAIPGLAKEVAIDHVYDY